MGVEEKRRRKSFSEYFLCCFIHVVGDRRKWTNGKLEAMYYDVTAERIESTGVKAVETERPEISVTHGSLRLGKEMNVSVYKDNGVLVYSGKTSVVENLPNGIYIVRIGNYAQKVFVK